MSGEEINGMLEHMLNKVKVAAREICLSDDHIAVEAVYTLNVCKRMDGEIENVSIATLKRQLFKALQDKSDINTIEVRDLFIRDDKTCEINKNITKVCEKIKAICGEEKYQNFMNYFQQTYKGFRGKNRNLEKKAQKSRVMGDCRRIRNKIVAEDLLTEFENYLGEGITESITHFKIDPKDKINSQKEYRPEYYFYMNYEGDKCKKHTYDIRIAQGRPMEICLTPVSITGRRFDSRAKKMGYTKNLHNE